VNYAAAATVVAPLVYLLTKTKKIGWFRKLWLRLAVKKLRKKGLKRMQTRNVVGLIAVLCCIVGIVILVGGTMAGAWLILLACGLAAVTYFI